MLNDEFFAPFARSGWDTARDQICTDRSTLRIGITGAQGVGKTTLARAIAAELHLPFIEEMARVVHTLGFPLGLDTNLLSQIAMWLGQFDLEHRFQRYIADRTLFDVVIHSLLLAERQQEQHISLCVNALGNATACIMRQHYSLLFYIPIEFSLVCDGVREENLLFQQKLDGKTRALLTEFAFPYIELSGSLEARMAQAKQAILQLQSHENTDTTHLYERRGDQ